MTIFEKINVVDEAGVIVRSFTREMDPRYYVLINIPSEASSVTRVRQLIEVEASQVPDTEPGGLSDSASEQPPAPID